MIELGKIPPIEVPELPFGFLALPEHAGKTFTKTFEEQSKQYENLLERSISGHCKFDESDDNKGLLKGSNPFVLALLREGNLLEDDEHLYSPSDFARAFNRNPKAFSGTYQDQGLIVTISPDQAKGKGSQVEKLAQEVYDAGFKQARPNSPIFVSHTILTPEKVGDEYIFGLNNTEGLVEDQAHANNNPIKTFDTYNEKTGLPVPVDIGKHAIYTVPEIPDVFRVFSYDDQSSFADLERLADSNSGGRVVVGSNVP